MGAAGLGFSARHEIQHGSTHPHQAYGEHACARLTHSPQPAPGCPLTSLLLPPAVAAADYLDMQNRRPDFLTNFVDNLIDWERVTKRYEAAL